MKQLHKKFTDYQIKELTTRYLKKRIARKYIQEILGIKKTRFFALVKRLKDDPENFFILYSRRIPTRKISKDIEKNIIKKLNTEKDYNHKTFMLRLSVMASMSPILCLSYFCVRY